MTITVSTDGSALGNPNGPMGWAWADHEAGAGTRGVAGHEHGGDCDAGGATNGTNQIGELCAVLEALRAHPGAEPLVIETDSQYAINCSTKWVHGWKRNGWKNSQKKPVKNAALIKAIDAELTRREGSVKFVWVKGHAGNAGNEKVDELARTYAGDCRSKARDGYLPKEGWESLLASEYARGVDVPEDARMLMDGRISAHDYHLGRGEDSADGTPRGGAANASGGARGGAEESSAGKGTDTRANGGKTPSAGKDTGSARPANGSGAARPDGAATDGTRQHRATATTKRPAAASQTDHAPAAPTPAAPATDTDSPAAPTTAAPAPAHRIAVGTAPVDAPERRAISTVNARGRLLVSPAPSTSRAFRGAAVHVLATIHVDAIINPDGMMEIDAPMTFDRNDVHRV